MNTIFKNYKIICSACIGIFTLAASSFACSEPDNKPLIIKTLNALFSQLVNNSGMTQRVIELNNNLHFNVALEGTSKGNGTLKIHNLKLRLFDQHDDGIVYEGGSLKLDLKDINGNKRKELIITGIVKYTGDDDSDPATYESFTQIYTYDCKHGIFISLYKNSAFSIELPTEKTKALKCALE